MIARAKSLEEKAEREPTPIVVTLFHREEDTRKMFEQLARVTDNYSLIIVNNGFDDLDFLETLKPLHHIENEENTGAIRPINQGLEVAQGEYIVVLHSDLLIYDEGWLDHIVNFMDSRPDVGLVGLRGNKTIREDGNLGERLLGTKPIIEDDNPKPPFRFTEVATIDGIGWVMRNIGLRLDEGIYLLNYSACDMSMQYVEEGHKVYMGAVDIAYLFGGKVNFHDHASTPTDEIGMLSDACFEKSRDEFARKWKHRLPISRGFRDELRCYQRIADLKLEIERGQVEMDEYECKAAKLLKDIETKDSEIRRAAERVALVEEENQAKIAELDSINSYRKELEASLSAEHPQQGPPPSGQPRTAGYGAKTRFLSAIRRVKRFPRSKRSGKTVK